MISTPVEAVSPPAASVEKKPAAPLVRWLVASTFVAGLLLRLVGLSYPPYDAHNFRQCQTLSTIDAFYSQGIDLLHPRTINTGYPGTMVLELPLFQAIGAMSYHVFGPHVEVIRLLNILFGAVSTWILFKITARLFDQPTAFLTSLIYWLAPLNILFQRSVLLDPMAVLCALLSFYSLALLLNPGPDRNSQPEPRLSPRVWVLFAVASFLTAMIKALYLWPAVLLLGYAFALRRFRLDWLLVRIVAVFAACALCLFVWNQHATAINRANAFIPGWKLTSHLGLSSLLVHGFYSEMLVHRPKWWLGEIGALLYALGLFAFWVTGRKGTHGPILLLLILVPPTYLLAFANINYPHEYYQLIVTPFLAMIAGFGAQWLSQKIPAKASVFRQKARIFSTIVLAGYVFAAGFSYVVWLRLPHLEERVQQFSRLCAGKFEPWAPAMLFVGATASHRPVDAYVPGYQYAAKLWGYGRAVQDAAGAKSQFDELAPAFPRLEYVVFYGTDCPDWLPIAKFRPLIKDDANSLYVFREVP